jgi:hypothetical protein
MLSITDSLWTHIEPTPFQKATVIVRVQQESLPSDRGATVATRQIKLRYGNPWIKVHDYQQESLRDG